MKLFFPDVQDFFLVNRDGEQFGSPYYIELGSACVADIGHAFDEAVSGGHFSYKPVLHPQFERVHFDMMFPTDIFGDNLLFFASFNAEILRQVLVNHKLSSHTSYLIRQDSKYLIELYEKAVRATNDFKIGYFLSNESIANIAYDAMVPGTGWRLVVVKDSQVYDAARRDFQQVATFQAVVVTFLWVMVMALILRYVTIQQRLLGRLHAESLRDELTGLGNRRVLKTELPKSIERY
ncbi:GGDEF domain-containing protein [Thiomicrorhabdus sediminis]|uniref:GGDEF domain-containing protein n=1 Tax=Thiomicrorhabdus sediminis TaxID=2580412 RepID=A0A4P9K4W7_9GAMM|nr:GGDEF domain-containing protein [Thiomicrorhabdus sediminis]QCU89460.1 GGDEF domain-containing protein [Thiomicrorhabdus sediminis]